MYKILDRTKTLVVISFDAKQGEIKTESEKSAFESKKII